ncbi:Uncharacterized conserved protein, DUF1800 family [bacterium A37T11]|nr:Uncharacterized conserved protein, DUF1800 family [bacterium A37T11]
MIKSAIISLGLILLPLVSWVSLTAFNPATLPVKVPFKFPYQQQGLDEDQAASHLISRFTYGARPGDLAQIKHQGLENWFMDQLNASLPEDTLDNLLSAYDAIDLSNADVVRIFPRGGQAVRMAIKEGIISKDSVNSKMPGYKKMLADYLNNKGLRDQKELFHQFVCQKILRAAYAQNQLQEVMTSFWLNHFNVSITKSDCARFIPAYERDVIRPLALGKFSDLLLATAKSPAMLYYLDNFSSTGSKPIAKYTRKDGPKVARIKASNNKKTGGLNENYAREVMELHTLGVDGGYNQQDVTEAARVLTGWSVYPMDYNKNMAQKLGQASEAQLEKRGYKHDGDFLFTPNRHDPGQKTILGKTFGPDLTKRDGYEEGVQLLNMLAHHRSTAAFIARKIAVRFVNDNPPQLLVDKMSDTFLEKNGDIRQVMITMVSAPEFWAKEAVREKTKSPFELAISAARNVDAQITEPYQLYNWINKMGERMYYYQAPTGFPDKGEYWINTGSLLSRMNFGLAFASGRIPGVKVDLAKLNNYHEPESSQAALTIYSKLILPDRDVNKTIGRLAPLLNDPALAEKVAKASNRRRLVTEMETTKGNVPMKDSQMLAQVVGIIIGSPEFQRR